MIVTSRTTSDSIVTMEGVSWETYTRLLEERGERPYPRLTYCDGVLELMSPSNDHEDFKVVISKLIEVWAAHHRIAIVRHGSPTIRRERKRKGLEPDEGFRFGPRRRRADHTDGEPEIPDLALEVEISVSAKGRMPVYAELGVREIWRFDGEQLTIQRLEQGTYVPATDSQFLPGFPLSDAGRWVRRALEIDDLTLADEFTAEMRDDG